MPFKVEEKFEVEAPVQRVWEYLIDPAKVVQCLPGAELLESKDERTFVGAVKVKVGPVTMSYKGLVKFTELNEHTHLVRLVAEGREAGGGGSVRVTMRSLVTAISTGGAEVVVDAEVDLVGRIVQFGRGMIEEVSRQLFRQFSTCVKQHLEAGEEAQSAQIAADAETKPVSAVPLALRALWAVITRFLARLFRKERAE